MKDKIFIIAIFVFSLSFLPACKAYISINEFKWHIADNGGAIIDSVMATGDQSALCLNLGGNYQYCTLYIATPNFSFKYPLITQNMSFLTRDAAEILNALHEVKLPLSFKFTQNSRLCPFIAAWNATGERKVTPLPGSACNEGGAPPAPSPSLVCNANNIEINYGTIDKNAVNGEIKQGVLNLDCSGKGVVHIYSVNYDSVNGLQLSDNGSLRSFLTIEGNDLKKGIVVKGENFSKNLNIISTLKNSGPVSEGHYQAFIIINMDLQ